MTSIHRIRPGRPTACPMPRPAVFFFPIALMPLALGRLSIIGNNESDMKNWRMVLNAGLLMCSLRIQGQTYSNLYAFSVYGGFPPANKDGATPYSVPVLSSNILYGPVGKAAPTVKARSFPSIPTERVFTNLHTFSALSSYPTGTNADGAQPYDGLLLSSNVLYGTAFAGGTNGWGTVFRIGIDGTGFTVLRSLNELNDGAQPRGGLILSSNTLFGTATMGGSIGSAQSSASISMARASRIFIVSRRRAMEPNARGGRYVWN